MAEYTIITTPDEQAALEWAASQADPPQDPATYFDARMHEVLHSYEQQHGVAKAPSPPADVAVAYVKAPTADQLQVDAILGMPSSRARS